MRKHILRFLNIVICLFMFTALTACTTFQQTFFPTKVSAQILASFDVNPDTNERPSPLVVRIYELKSINAFGVADFFKLYDEEQATLGGDLISREEFELSPGEGREVVRETHDQTRYFAVIAAYRNLDKSRWRASTVLQLNSRNSFIVKIGKQSVTINQQ